MTTGVLSLDRMKELLNLNTGFFETSRYTLETQMAVTSGNHDDAGLSIGNLQYNFGPADRAQEYFLFMLNNHDSVVRTAFGTNTTQYTEFDTVIRTYTRAQRITWGDGITDYVANSEGRVLKEPWKTSFANILLSSEGIAKYMQMQDTYYFPSPYDLFRQMSCTSRIAFASFFDLMVNKGRYYPINLLQLDFEAIDNNATLSDQEKEAQKVYQINLRGNEEENALSDSSSTVFWERRGCMANMGGDYYGALYDPETQFDMNLEPAIQEKVKSLGVKLGSIEVDNVFLGTTPIQSIYLGATLLGGGASYTTTKAPTTQFRTGLTWEGITGTSVTLTNGQPLWVDVTNFVACKTYYTIDGSTPTTNSALYDKALTFNQSCTLKTLTVSIFGVAEAVKTLTVNIVVAPTTTISPSATVQNTIPFTVTLSTSETGATIYYKLGTSATVYTYTAPFTVNQNSPGVASTNIKVTYWAVGASATEAEKSITYDTSGAVPAKPVVTVTNGVNQVKLDWAVTANTTSYSIFRSTTLGTLGTALSQYQSANTFTDTTAVGGTTYYYTVQAGNYGRATNSDQVTGLPTTAPTVQSWRYLKIEGYGTATDATTRIIEFEAFEGTTNRMTNSTILSHDVMNNTTKPSINTIKDGSKATTANTYPFWWTTPPNANVVIDLGAAYPLSKLVYTSFSISTDQRKNRFKILASNTNNGTDWTTIWDMSSIDIPTQPVLPSGYETTL